MALQNIYCLQYNNYFNRKLKREATMPEYQPYVVYQLTRVAFNPNDGVQATQVINTSVACDYFIVTDLTGTEIDSRWFVVESRRERNGQYTLVLRRDLVADYYEPLINSTCYIEKATLGPDDPFIFNKEGAGYNQIKQSETLLKDESKSKWLCAFVSKKREQDFSFVSNIPSTYHLSAASKSAWAYSNYIDNKVINDIDKITINTRVSKGSFITVYDGIFSRSQYIDGKTSVETYTDTSYKLRQNSATSNPEGNELAAIYNQVNVGTILADFNFDTTINTNNLRKLDGKRIHFDDENKTYKISVIFANEVLNKGEVTVNSALYLELKNAFLSNDKFEYLDEAARQNPFRYTVQGDTITIQLTEISTTSLTYTLPKTNNEKGLKDQPFDIIMCPFDYEHGKATESAMPTYNYPGSTGADYIAYNYNNAAAIDIMTQIASNTSLCYDLQLLPYYIPGEGVSQWSETDASVVITDKTKIDIAGDKTNSVFFQWPSKSSFRNLIKLDDPVYITETKVQNECDLYRFVAPNYGSAFDFNAAMNGGLFSVEINCTYLPYQSYIHVNPTFGGLYGQDFDDQRGLVCGGNYSLSAISDAWKNYVTQNKNYAEIFDREIQNMEVNRKYQKQQEVVNMITGTISGAASGAIGGSMLSTDPATTIIGGVAGGAAALAGGIADLNISQKLYDESKSYKEDMQRYSLGNIEALPTSLARTSAYNVDNKYYPFIEYYTCTEKEKQALRDQIAYTGMTVRRTGKIRDYLQNDYSYVQAKIIRIEDIADDSHVLVALADEIHKGVYIK